MMKSVRNWGAVLILQCMLLLPVSAWAGTVELPQTGLTICIDQSGTEINCAGTGQDGDIQAGVPWPEPRFTDNGDGTVTDGLTGLMWTQDAGTPTVGGCGGNTMSWQSALDYVACLNSMNHLGYGDWRLPNVNELESLVNIGAPRVAPWLNGQGFSNVITNFYWSSTTYVNSSSSAWAVNFGHANVNMYPSGAVMNMGKTSGYYTLPVRQ